MRLADKHRHRDIFSRLMIHITTQAAQERIHNSLTP